MQISIKLVVGQLDDIFFRQVESDAMLSHIGQIGHALTTPGADFEVVLHRITFCQGAQQGNIDGHGGTREIGVRLCDFMEVGEQFVDFDDGQAVGETIFPDDVFLVAALILKDKVKQVRMPDDAPKGFGEFMEFIHFR